MSLYYPNSESCIDRVFAPGMAAGFARVRVNQSTRLRYEHAEHMTAIPSESGAPETTCSSLALHNAQSTADYVVEALSVVRSSLSRALPAFPLAQVKA